MNFHHKVNGAWESPDSGFGSPQSSEIQAPKEHIMPLTGNSSELVENKDNNNVVCEAVNCYAKASTKISVNVGIKGTIPLFLCENCKPRFHCVVEAALNVDQMNAFFKQMQMQRKTLADQDI